MVTTGTIGLGGDGDGDAGKAQTVAGHQEQTAKPTQGIAADLRAVEELQESVFNTITQRPDLMARMSEVQKEKAKLRDGVSEMMLQKEWNQ